ncbi:MULTISPECIES: cold-shock protein [Cohnella]|uniref:cold-shock protein n=1 Tax=Cohnella TaxID=329857 RepID=UPI0009BB75E3|nr:MULTISPECIES: cold-shock protein [Cohnella]MBN2981641.1 cold-shock protein [Cohnella algarum]
MYNSRKKPLEEVPTELTPIWSCSNENCNGWMRENFVLSPVPVCPQCQSDMHKDERMLPVIVNTSFPYLRS